MAMERQKASSHWIDFTSIARSKKLIESQLANVDWFRFDKISVVAVSAGIGTDLEQERFPGKDLEMVSPAGGGNPITKEL